MCNVLAKQNLVPGAKVQVTLERGNSPFPQNEGSNAIIALAQDIYSELGRNLKLVGAGGVSDANWAAAAGATVMDSLGPMQGGKNHTEDESSNVSSVVPRMYLLAQLFMHLGQNKLLPGIALKENQQ